MDELTMSRIDILRLLSDGFFAWADESEDSSHMGE